MMQKQKEAITVVANNLTHNSKGKQFPNKILPQQYTYPSLSLTHTLIHPLIPMSLRHPLIVTRNNMLTCLVPLDFSIYRL